MDDDGSERSTAGAVEAPTHGILVVESDPDQQWRLARRLTVDGNRVVGTSSADGALALVSRWPVDLVLVAEDLPGMEGLELVRRLHETCEGVQVVLMTHDDGPDVRVAAALAGATGCLRKPVRSAALAEIMARALGSDIRPSLPPPALRDISAAE